MAFTTVETVRRHLLASSSASLAVENLPLKLEGLDPVSLPHQKITDRSDVVKWTVENEPVLEGPLLLEGVNWTALSYRPLVAESEVVTLGESLETVFVARRDYLIDATAGGICRVSGGQIADPRYVFIYYYYYELFERDADYLCDPVAGTICRTPGSRIPDGAEVLVSYQQQWNSVSDELIALAMAEAHDQIVRTLATGYNESSTDQGLKTGETELVLAILARDLATDALALHTGSDAAGRAREWLSLATQQEGRAWQTLCPFLDPGALHNPEKRNAR